MKQEIPEQTADHASELQANLKEIKKLYCSVADKEDVNRFIRQQVVELPDPGSFQ